MHHYIAELFDVLSARRRFPFHMAVAAYNRMLLLPLFGMHWSDDGGGEPRFIGKYIVHTVVKHINEILSLFLFNIVSVCVCVRVYNVQKQ